ncbi:MAG: PAS domain S-box protein [Candidatus Aminicenantales bacterium]
MNDKNLKGQSEVEVLLEYANSILATLREPFLVLDKKLRVISANQAFYSTFKVKAQETIGRPLPGLGDGQWDIPVLIHLLKEIIPGKAVIQDYEVEHEFAHLGRRFMLLNARQLRVPKQVAAVIATGAGGEEELILLAIEDITVRKRLQKELQESEERYRRAFETSLDGLVLVHKVEATILNSNASIQELLGYSHEELLKKKLWDIGVTKGDMDFQATLAKLESDGIIHYDDLPVKTKTGLSVHAEVFLIDKAKVVQCNIRDVTESKKMQNDLKEKMRDLERFSKFAVDRELKMEELEKKEKELEEKLKDR